MYPGWSEKARPERQGRTACVCLDLLYEAWLGRLFLLGHGSSLQVIHRFILNPTTEPLTVLAPCAAGPRLLIPSIHLQSPTPRLGLVWCTGPAWICIRDLVGSQLEHTIDLSLLCRRPYRGWTHRGWCVSGADKRTSSPPSCHVACASGADRSMSAILPRCMLELGAQIR